MNIIQRITREPVLLIGVVTAVFGVLNVFDIGLTEGQIGAIVAALGAIMALVRFLVTPASEVVVQEVPGQAPKAGAAADLPTGAPVTVTLARLPDAA